MKLKTKRQVTFGSFDGMTSAISIIIPMLMRNDLKQLGVVVFSLALGDGFTMGLGEFLSDKNPNDIDHAFAMGLSTAIAIILPAVPFFMFSTGWALLWAIVMIVGWSYIIGDMSNKPHAIQEVFIGVAGVAMFGVAIVMVMGG